MVPACQGSSKFLVLLALLAGVIVGCANSPLPSVSTAPPSRELGDDSWPRTSSKSGAPSGDWLNGGFTDLPIPGGFTLLADESFVFVQGPLRSADLKYAGSETVSQLIRFYQELMPTHGWQLLRMTGVRMKTLSYLKGDEICEIIVERHAPHKEHEGEREGARSWALEGRWEQRGQGEGLTHLHIQLNTR